MRAKAPAQAIPLRAKLDNLLDHHGAIAVLWSLARALLIRRRRRARLSDINDLSPHLRRDIGLHDPPPRPHHWDHFV